MSEEFDFDEFEREFNDFLESGAATDKDKIRDYVNRQKEELKERFGIDVDNLEVSNEDRILMNCLTAAISSMETITLTVDASELPREVVYGITLIGTSLKMCEAEITKKILKEAGLDLEDD